MLLLMLFDQGPQAFVGMDKWNYFIYVQHFHDSYIYIIFHYILTILSWFLKKFVFFENDNNLFIRITITIISDSPLLTEGGEQI